MINWIKYKFLTPKAFYATSNSFLPWLTGAFIVLFFYGLFAGLFIVPADYQQGDGFRMMYVHVPSAFAGMGIYFVMAISAMLTLVWRIKIAAISMACSAPIGAWFTFLALVTGAIWGKPMWGTWWIWDARLTSMLILLFLYLGFMALRSVITDTQSRDRASSIIALVGAINLPIIHYSVVWWNTLHQASSFNLFAAPAIAPVMLYPLLSAITAFFLFYFIILIIRMQSEILSREIKTEWVKKVMLA
jgi:heme exporter protein C